MSVIRHTLLVLAGILGTAAILRSCPPGWVNYGHSCYKVATKEKLNWNEAFETCQSLGAHLIVPSTLDEKQFIRGMAHKALCQTHEGMGTCQHGEKQLWFGCREKQQGALCSDIENHKNPHAPGTKCLLMTVNSPELSEVACSAMKQVMCEGPQVKQNAIHCFVATDDPDDHMALPYCLLDHTYMEIPITQPMQCCIACSKDPDCLSFNLSDNMCQLNNVTISQFDDRFLIKTKNCSTYYLE